MIAAVLALIMTSREYLRLDVFHGVAVQNVASGIQIDGVYALNTVQYFDNGVNSNNNYLPIVIGPPYECASFTNVSQKVATAVEFKFSYIDTIGDTVGSDELMVGGTFSPNVPIDGSRKQCRAFRGEIDTALDFYYAGRHSTMAGTVVYVKFADGSSWRGSP